MYQTVQFLYTGEKIRLIKLNKFSFITKCIALVQDVPCKTQHKDKTRINSETSIRSSFPSSIGTSNINRVAQISWLTVAL